MSQLGPSPLAAGDPNVTVAQARAAIASVLRPISQSMRVPLGEALGRVLAVDLISPIDVPAHDNSAMDGFVFAGSALRTDSATALHCVGTVFAGAPFAGTLGPGQCLRIMTGAVMPTGLDTVVPQELCLAQGDQVRIQPGVIALGDNRRRRGEDLAFGTPALRAGRVLKPADMGLIASLGIGEVTVQRRLRVALFSTGNELRCLGQPLAPGCVYDSNRHSLSAALQRLGMEVIDLGLVRDDPLALQTVLEAAVARADVVLTSGGVSVGEADHTREVLARMGEVAFWKVAMRPGRPFAFGPLRSPLRGDLHGELSGELHGDLSGDLRGANRDASTWLFALPGNPVAALVCFYAFAREALLVLAGAHPEPLPVLQARCTTAIRKRPGRTEFQRAIVEAAPDGSGWQVRLTGSQGAGVLRSMSEANALLVLRHEQGSVAAGEPVDVWLFDGLT